MGGCSFSIYDILIQPKSGWFKLLDLDKAEYRCVPVLEEKNVLCSKDDENEESTREDLDSETKDATLGEIDVELDTEISKDVSDSPCPEMADIKSKEGEQETDDENSNTRLDNNDAFTANTVKYDSRKINFRFSKTGTNLNNVVFDDISKQLPDADTGK